MGVYDGSVSNSSSRSFSTCGGQKTDQNGKGRKIGLSLAAEAIGGVSCPQSAGPPVVNSLGFATAREGNGC